MNKRKPGDQIKIIIADDKPWFRSILRRELLDFKLDTIAEAGNGLELLRLLEIHSPDVILLDLEMPEMNGSITMDHVSENYPERKVIVFSQHNDYELSLDFERRGAKGFIAKDEAMSDMALFAGIIRKVHRGGKYFVKDHTQPKLSERQRDIVYLSANGVSTKQAAELLGMSENGLGKQQRKIMQKRGFPTVVTFYNQIVKSGMQFLRFSGGDDKSSSINDLKEN
jgi:DNA-binding NarL/FixJ family response regulator